MYDKFYGVCFPQPEKWVDVVNHEGDYSVSNYGEIKSHKRTVSWITKNGNYGCKYVEERILKPKYDKDGYESYCLSKDGCRSDLRGHRIVAEGFIQNVKNVEVVDHKDARKTNNCAWNLQWMTSEENTIKYYAKEYGKTKSLSSLSKQEWLLIGELYKQGKSYTEIFNIFGIDAESPQTLWEGLSGRRLSSITGFKKGDFEKRPHPVQKLSDKDVEDIIKKRLLLKIPLKLLSSEYKIAESMISRFCSGTRRTNILAKLKIEGVI